MMHTLLALLLFVVVFVVPNQVIAEDGVKDSVEKRQVSVLARDGHLPYEGKRYVGQAPQDSKSSDNNVWNMNQEPSVFLATNKRYVGALAKTGDLRQFKQAKRNDDVDTLMDYLRKGEEMRRLRLEALREEMLRESEDEDYEVDAEKRSLASLARTGDFPLRENKRGGIASMAKAGFLKGPSSYMADSYQGKRGISSLARNGQMPSFGKRGGISSLMRNGYSNQKRAYGTDLDDFLFGEFDVLDKRNVASLARDYSLPNMGKKNIASFAKNGWMQGFGSSPKRSYYDFEDLEDIYPKRNIPSLLRNRVSPLVPGKRYLGAFVASNKLPYSRQSSDDFKRNIGSFLRTADTNMGRPRFGKRDWDDEDELNEDIANEYISSQISEPYSLNDDSKDFLEFANPNEFDEQKRHIGSVLSQKSFMRKKKSITPEDQLSEQSPTTASPTKSLSDENKMDNDIQRNHNRQKRDAFGEISSESDEYTMPVLQNTQSFEYEDGTKDSSVEESTRKKRYFGALARSGWLPNNHYYKGAVGKRHIGALARLGWLPSFRSVRGYTRFGRDVRSPCKRSSPPTSEGWRQDPGWSSPSRGEVPVQQPQLWSSSWPLEGADGEEDVEDPVKRYLLIPALDNILLRKQPINWIH